MRKFGFTTSEDALTWTVFSYLQEQNSLAKFARSFLAIEPSSEPVLLLWGAPVPKDSGQRRMLRRSLSTVLDGLRDNKQSYSEPDVVLDFGMEGLVFIEVKYLSGNDLSANTLAIQRYVDASAAFADHKRAISSGMYELVRNWRIGTDLAGIRPFTLLNLVVRRSRGAELGALKEFSASLEVNGARRFKQALWNDVLPNIDIPPWLASYTKRLGIQRAA